MDIKQFQDDVRALSQHLDTKSPERRVLYLMSEVGELVDEVLDLLNTEDDDKQAEIKSRLGMEIYDVIWNAVDLANQLDIDLETAFEVKIAHNKERIWRRSGKLDTD